MSSYSETFSPVSQLFRGEKQAYYAQDAFRPCDPPAVLTRVGQVLLHVNFPINCLVRSFQVETFFS